MARDWEGDLYLHWFGYRVVIGLQSAGLAAAYFPED